MNWRKNYTDIDEVNNGQEFENSDYPTKEAFNVALNNTAYLKTTQDSQATSISNIEQRLNDLGFKLGYYTAFITYIDENEEGDEYEVTVEMSSSDINNNTLTREGNRFLIDFFINQSNLRKYVAKSFVSLRLIPHGRDVSDSYFKINRQQAQSVEVKVGCRLSINYQQFIDIDIAIQALVNTNPTYIYFSMDYIQNAITNRGYHVGIWEVQNIVIDSAGLEAED